MDQIQNNYPIIGILCIDIANVLSNAFDKNYKSYIAASYVKFLESAGARVIPIWIGKDESYYENILNNINGVLLPGGAVFFDKSEYSEAGHHIYKIATKMNENNCYMPLFGICLGYELLMYVSSMKGDPREDCKAEDQSLPLIFKEDFREGKLFRNISSEMEKIFKENDVTYNYHRYCITEKYLLDSELDKNWKVLAVNKDKDTMEYISVVEHKKYPYYGLQFHPEKNIFEWKDHSNIQHTPEAIKASLYFSNFFVNEARKNANKFLNVSDQSKHFIWNFPITYTGDKSNWIQCYLFAENVDYK